MMGHENTNKRNLLVKQSLAVYEFIKAHPGCTRFQITMELNMLDTEFRKVRTELGQRVYSVMNRGAQQANFYVTEGQT